MIPPPPQHRGGDILVGTNVRAELRTVPDTSTLYFFDVITVPSSSSNLARAAFQFLVLMGYPFSQTWDRE